MLRVVTFKLDEETLEKLDTFARLKGYSRSEVIRQALELYMRIEEKKTMPKPKIVRI